MTQAFAHWTRVRVTARGLIVLEHRRVLREAFAAHAGVEVDTQGDAFFIAFSTATGATSATARLWGAIESEEAAAPIGQWPGYRAEYERLVFSAAAPTFEQARAEGRLLSLGEAAGLD